MGLYSYQEMMEYLKSISFKCLGYGDHIQQQCEMGKKKGGNKLTPEEKLERKMEK